MNFLNTLQFIIILRMKKCVLNYEIDKNCLLGKGGFGSVYLARNELNLEYACKIM